MQSKKLHNILFVLNFLTVQIVVVPVASSLSYENKDFVKIKQDPTRFQQASAYRNKKSVFASSYLNTTTAIENNDIHTHLATRPSIGVDRNYSHEKNNNIGNNETVTQASHYKKWQVGRVSRKQYEIINMLWRKTKIFVNLEETTSNYHSRKDNDTKKVIDGLRAPRKPFHRFASRPNLPSTTSSYIEFYYLDETDERGKDFTTLKHTISNDIREHKLRSLGNFKFILADSPMFAFRVDDANYKRPKTPTTYMPPTNRMRRRKTRTLDSSLIDFDTLNSLTSPYKFSRKFTQQNKIIPSITIANYLKENITLNESINISTTEYSIDNETCPITTEALTTFNDTTESENISSYSMKLIRVTKPTTAYDKIKFFEIYDKHTPVPYYDEKGKLIDMDNIEIYIKGNELNDERKILLEHVDQSIGNEHSNPHKGKHAKKHIIDNNKNDFKGHNNDILADMKPSFKFATNKTLNVTKLPLKQLLLAKSRVTNLLEYKKSKYAKWSQYPFAAAYVYEPSQVHCDAAGISPHWLITSGSCLSRHHKHPGGDGRSAFVTYCGESWWNPELTAYVQYSVVHPRFHPRDRTRKHLYNIGLIQVVNSMASACSGWSPISLMSHQYVADVAGSVANAVGWGLDRFDTRYSSNDLPKSPLQTYQSLVYSDSCPGNVGYSKAKRLDEEGGIKNVYCLTLPPYSGEGTDPVHGGLLLVGGKLVALYLQEERRPWGDQCAQYTGTWRLVPWVLDVARENDEPDIFNLEI